MIKVGLRKASVIGWWFGALPFAWLAGVVVLAIRARLYLGYLPKPSRPDPKLLPFEIHHACLWAGLYLLPLALASGATVYVLDAMIFKRGFDRRPLMAFLGGGSLIVALIFGLYGDYNWVAWFLD